MVNKFVWVIAKLVSIATMLGSRNYLSVETQYIG